MEPQLKYQDLLYFGYDWGDEASENRKLQADFVREITERFPNVKLLDKYDSIKGYRQEVYLEESDNDNYYSWLIGRQWFEMSMTFTLIMAASEKEPEQKKAFDTYFALAKKQYPEIFKTEALNN